MPRSDDPNDPRGLIQESFRIDGIDLGQCRGLDPCTPSVVPLASLKRTEAVYVWSCIVLHTDPPHRQAH